MTKADIEGMLFGLATGSIGAASLVTLSRRQWWWSLACAVWFLMLVVHRKLNQARIDRILAGWNRATTGWQNAVNEHHAYVTFIRQVFDAMLGRKPPASKTDESRPN